MEAFYIKADSRNLPTLELEDIFEYAISNADILKTEFRHWKIARSSNALYGEDAIGKVRVHFEQNKCTVRASIVPEHRVNDKLYELVLVLANPPEQRIQKAECVSCVASAGTCKHIIAFLFWMNRRNNEKSVTEVTCYWKKAPRLKRIGQEKLKPLSLLYGKTESDGKLPPGKITNIKNLLFDSIKLDTVPCSLASYLIKDEYTNMKIYKLMAEYIKDDESSMSFSSFSEDKMTPELCLSIELHTRNQCKDTLWHQVRYGRITGSTFHAAANCQTDGSLVQMILGARYPLKTSPVLRGKKLEPIIFMKTAEYLSKTYGLQESTTCGIFLRKDCPLYGASPDGICGDFIIEIKCPYKRRTVSTYVKDGCIQKKIIFQMQLEMHCAEKSRGILAIADPEFEKNFKITFHTVQYNEQLVKMAMLKCTIFWYKYVYNKLK